jgi:NarL family two-component system sensor histidine kinase YdfH
MTTNSAPKISDVERDSNLFVWIMTLVVAGMYANTLYTQPATRQLASLIPFSLLVLVHIILHWQLGKIVEQPSKLFWYILFQGVLVIIILAYAKNIGMTFALFMGLIGEAVGLFRLTRRGVLAGVYYLVLMVASLVQLSGWDSSRMLLLGTIPMLLFVVVYVSLYMRQNEAREKALSLAAELETANRQLSEYAARVEDLTIANERQRMARELHDTLSQGLAGLILQLEAADAHLNSNRNDKARSIVANAMLQARATLTDARSAIDDLRQTPLDDLDTALRHEVSRFMQASGIHCVYHSDPTLPLPEPIIETIIRAVAEVFTNITKHARAKNVELSVAIQENSLLVTVRDDGKGFDALSIPDGHYGLLGIKERVHLLDGQFEINSQIGKGTTLSIELPL